MNDSAPTETLPSIKSAVDNVLNGIEREREREIISRRFGLNDRKETLEQIGELLGITRERVRQLEKAILIRLKIAAEEGIPEVTALEKQFIRHLHDMGRAAKVSDLSKKVTAKDTEQDRAHVAFVAELAPNLTVLNENDNYHHGVAIKEYNDEAKLKKNIDEIVKTVKTHGEALTAEELHEKTNHEHPDHVRAYASLSKNLATLKDKRGLTK